MRKLEGEQLLVRVLLGESDRWHHQPLSMALLQRLRNEGFAGATVFHGVAGFEAHSMVHTVVIEIVDTEEVVQSELMPILDDMVDEGLVTVERVRVVKYAPGN